MVLTLEQRTKVLEELGLTISEARVYVALARIGSAKIGIISKSTSIHRANLYPILVSLERRCLIEKEITSPVKYHPIPPQEALAMLVRNKQQQLSDLSTKAQEVIQSLECPDEFLEAKTPSKEGVQFLIIPGKDVIINRLKKALQCSQKSVDVITVPERFSSAFLFFADDYLKATKKGVNIRLAVEKHLPEKEVLIKMRALKSINGNHFQVKYLPSPSRSIMCIFDEREIFLSFSATANIDKTSSLWTNNQNVVAMAKGFFDYTWNQGSPLTETQQGLYTQSWTKQLAEQSAIK